MTSSSPPSEKIKLQPKDIVKPDDLTTWELAWTKGVTPWDFGEVQPAFREAVESSGLDLPRSGRALVPGCGAGYDVPYIASTLGLNTIGLEVSETAIGRANELFIKTRSLNPSLSAHTSIEKIDFFTFDPPTDKLFNLVYDHTFFVAIPPAMRSDWGKQMAKLIISQGYLITLVFPIRPFDETGPPYYVQPEHYAKALGSKFVKILDKIPTKSSPSHEGKERLLVWRRV